MFIPKFYGLNLFFKRSFKNTTLDILRSYARQLLFIALHNSLTKQRPENFKASETRESVNYVPEKIKYGKKNYFAYHYNVDVHRLQTSFEYNKVIVTRSQVTFRRAIIMFPM